MFFKLTIFSVLVAFTLAGDYEYAAPHDQLNGNLSGKLNNNNNDVKDTYNIYTASEAPQSYNNNNNEDYTSYTTAQTPAAFNNGNNNNSGEFTYDSYTPEPATYNNNNNNNNNNEHGYNYKQYLEQEARKEEQQQQKSQQPQLKQVYQQQQQKQLDSPAFYYAPAKYDYNYAVHDDFTGDIKSHSETRDGNSVKGSYSVVDPDGYQRIVTYTADEVSGFNAVVNRVPYALPVKTVVTKTAPTEVKTSASSVAIEPRDSYASAPKAGSHPDGPYA